MKQLIIDTLIETRNKLDYMKVSNMNISDRIKHTLAIEKINFCIKVLTRFNINS